MLVSSVNVAAAAAAQTASLLIECHNAKGVSASPTRTLKTVGSTGWQYWKQHSSAVAMVGLVSVFPEQDTLCRPTLCSLQAAALQVVLFVGPELHTEPCS